jgi:short-chain fatty acids transporter
MVTSTVAFFDRMMREYTPDPFLLCLFLTMVLFVMGVTFTPSSPKDMVFFWGSGFWALIQFTLQMVMILVGGYVIAIAPPSKRFLASIASLVKTPGQAVVVITLVALTASYINWGLGLVVGGILCREIYKVLPSANYRLLVASSYSGFIVWHGGLSGSIPLVIATPGHFTEHLIGGTIPVTETLLSPLNIAAVVGMFILLPLSNWFLGRIHPNSTPVVITESKSAYYESDRSVYMPPAERIENSRLFSWVISAMGFSFIGIQVYEHNFSFTLNDINFSLLFLAIFLHGTPRSLLNAMTEAASKVSPILLQFPFYAGIMGMIESSKLADMISNWFVETASVHTFPLLTFYSAGLLNLFIPSGGGQWAVQGPVILEAATKMGASIPHAAMAVAWGDAWTNLLQPFWALPVLAIAGLQLREIMGYCVALLFITGAYLSCVFLMFG